MAGIKAPIQDIISKLATNTSFQFVRVWNRQIRMLYDGETYSYPLPACFVEVINPAQYEQMGLGYTQSEITFRIHIAQEYYDAQDGTFEQNYTIFDLRDEVIALLTYYEPTACSGLQKTNEEQDYEHTQLYHYMVDFKCSFIDSKGDQTVNDIDKQPPTGLELDITIN
jgi:hypothetical protein